MTGRPVDLTKVRDRFRILELDRRQPTEEDLELFRRAVEHHDLALEILDRAHPTAIEARYHTNFDDVPVTLIVPNLLLRLRLAALLRARATVARAEGRPQDAWRDAAEIYRLASWCGRSMPTLINVLVARAVAHDADLLVQDLLEIALRLESAREEAGAYPPELGTAANEQGRPDLKQGDLVWWVAPGA